MRCKLLSGKTLQRSIHRMKTKPGRVNRPNDRQFHYGIEIPKNYKEAIQLDRKNGNHKWFEAVQKEVASLLALKCFSFPSPDVHCKYTKANGWQYAPLRIVFDVKHDL